MKNEDAVNILLTHRDSMKIKAMNTNGKKTTTQIIVMNSNNMVRNTSQAAVVVKNPPANAGDTRDTVSIPTLGRSLGLGNGNTLHCPCLKETPWTEEPGGLQFTGSQRVGHD